MNIPDNPAPAPLSGQRDGTLRLVQELVRVYQAVRGPHTTAGPEASLTAIIRIVPDMDKTEWQIAVGGGLVEGWFSIDLPPGSDLQTLAEATSRAVKGFQDQVTGMLKPGAFVEELTMCMERTLHSRLSCALILFEIVDWTSLTDHDADSALRALSSRLWEVWRRHDILGRLQSGLLALALPGAGHFQALALAESVMHDVCRNLDMQGFGICPIRAGVASPGRDADPARAAQNLMERAFKALGQSSCGINASVRDRVRLFRDGPDAVERETLVLADEKHFLFFGGA